MEYQYHTETRWAGTEMTPQELAEKKANGWELCNAEGGIGFDTSHESVKGGGTARYIFRRPSKA